MRRAVGAGVRSQQTNPVAVIQAGGGGCVERERLDSERAQGCQLAGLGLAVGIAVAPQAQVRKGGVTGVNRVVGVEVERSQGGKAVAGVGAIGQARTAAKELAAIVDQAVVVKVEREPGVAARQPARALALAVGVDIEHDTGLGAQGSHAIAVEIERQGREFGKDFRGDLRVRRASRQRRNLCGRQGLGANAGDGRERDDLRGR